MLEPVDLWITDAVGWFVVGAFVAAWALESRGGVGRAVGAGAWGAFGVFWLLLVPRFAFEMRSPIEGALAVLAVPACGYAGYLLWSGSASRSMVTLTRAVAVMGVIYLPFETIPLLRGAAVETVAAQTHGVITWLGYDVVLTDGPNGYRTGLEFSTAGQTYATHIVLACTGLGSMTIFAGLIAALEAPLSRKLQAVAAAVGIIYVLNIVRNVFIAVAFGNQWFQVFVAEISAIMGYSDPGLVSYFIADRVIAQSMSVVALVAIAFLVVRIVPELLDLLEEAVYVLTHTEVDLEAALRIDER
jgi:archaeosortase A (PGF-CTERM-specific)